MLRNRADYRSIAFLLAILALEISALVFFRDIPGLALLPVYFVLAMAVFTATLINHNHRHLSTFDNAWMNRAFNYVLTVAMGAPSTRLHLVHMRNHHKCYRTTDDWSHYSLARNGRGLRRTLTYYVFATYHIGTMRKNISMTSAEARELRIEYAIFVLWILAWMAVDLKAALLILAPAYLGGQFILLIANLINHDHCDLGSPFNLARTFDSRFENWLFLNHGFHAVHHRRTTLHWSKLRQVHESHFRDKTDPKLLRKSFLGYFFRHYLVA